MTRPLQERFDEKYMPEPNSGCWLWISTMGKSRYGQIQKKENGRPGMRYAHRISWELHNGEIPANAHVLHKCDNPSCVNPNHLFLGSQSLNMKDKVRKGRHPKGENSASSKITEADAIAIFNDTRLHKAIAELYSYIIDGLVYYLAT
jgi:hypothetical protein